MLWLVVAVSGGGLVVPFRTTVLFRTRIAVGVVSYLVAVIALDLGYVARLIRPLAVLSFVKLLLL